MPRVLIVAYYFSPIGGIGSIRLTRFASILPELGWDVTVLAPRDTPHEHDPRLEFPEKRVVRARSIELSSVGRAALSVPAGEAATSRSRPVIGALRSAAHHYVFFPDPQIGWYPGAVSAGRQLVREQRFDAVYSSSNPMTAHLIARTLSRRAGLPWVAEFRDPWADRRAPDYPYKRAAAGLERRLAREATRVVMPSPTWARHYGEHWGVEVDVVPNGADIKAVARQRPERPTLTHVGTYYPADHDLSAVWRALARMRKDGAAELPRLRFVGPLPDEVPAELRRYGLEDLIESTGFVPHDEAMREMASTSMLLASGAAGDDAARRGWVPAKLFDYLATSVPILYVADAESDAAQLLAGRPGCNVVAPDDVDGAAAALAAGLSGGDFPRDVTDLSRETRARSLAEVLERASRASR
jgi:glycosyltransferase involved in cell wall biosynthesis